MTPEPSPSDRYYQPYAERLKHQPEAAARLVFYLCAEHRAYGEAELFNGEMHALYENDPSIRETLDAMRLIYFHAASINAGDTEPVSYVWQFYQPGIPTKLHGRLSA